MVGWSSGTIHLLVSEGLRHCYRSAVSTTLFFGSDIEEICRPGYAATLKTLYVVHDRSKIRLMQNHRWVWTIATNKHMYQPELTSITVDCSQAVMPTWSELQEDEESTETLRPRFQRCVRKLADVGVKLTVISRRPYVECTRRQKWYHKTVRALHAGLRGDCCCSSIVG